MAKLLGQVHRGGSVENLAMGRMGREEERPVISHSVSQVRCANCPKRGSAYGTGGK